MRLLYPSEPFSPRLPDEVFGQEAEAAQEFDLGVSAVGIDDLLTEPRATLRRLAANDEDLARAWTTSDSLDGLVSTSKKLKATGPVVLENYMKSEKCRWLEATFVPDVADETLGVVEIGDGQVSDRPSYLDPHAFTEALIKDFDIQPEGS